jgi:hypothetical protein
VEVLLKGGLLSEDGVNVGRVSSFGSEGCASAVGFIAPGEPGRYYIHARDEGNSLVFAYSLPIVVVAKATQPGRRW